MYMKYILHIVQVKTRRIAIHPYLLQPTLSALREFPLLSVLGEDKTHCAQSTDKLCFVGNAHPIVWPFSSDVLAFLKEKSEVKRLK